MSNDLLEQALPLFKMHMQSTLINRVSEKEIKFISYMSNSSIDELYLKRFLELMTIVKKAFSMRAFSKFKLENTDSLENDVNAFGRQLLSKSVPQLFAWRRVILDEEFARLNIDIPKDVHDHAEVFIAILKTHGIDNEDRAFEVMEHIQRALNILDLHEMCENEEESRFIFFKFYCVSINNRLDDILKSIDEPTVIPVPEEIVDLLKAVHSEIESKMSTNKRRDDDMFFNFGPKSTKNTVH